MFEVSYFGSSFGKFPYLEESVYSLSRSVWVLWSPFLGCYLTDFSNSYGVDGRLATGDEVPPGLDRGVVLAIFFRSLQGFGVPERRKLVFFLFIQFFVFF